MTRPVPIDRALLESMPLPWPQEGSKDNRGHVTVVGGSRETPGAALLASIAALRAGAGILQVATVESRAAGMALAMPEAQVIALEETSTGGIARAAAGSLLPRLERSRAVLLGPGMIEDEDADRFVAAILEGLTGPAFVLDAGALCKMLELRRALATHGGRVVITPHAGEMANLRNVTREAVEADPLRTACEVSGELQVVVVMKGATTHIAAPDGREFVYGGGGVGLATSGSGDTLAGLIAGLAARGVAPVEAALWGVYLHGEAGARLARSIGPLGYLAREIPDQAPRIMGEFGGGRR